MWAAGRRTANPLHQRFRGPEWREIRVDLDPDVEPDLVASITDLHPIAEELPRGCRLVLAQSEALASPRGARGVGRTLLHPQPRRVVLITLPDLQQVAEFIVADKLEEVAYESAVGPITPLDCVFGLGKDIAAGRTLMAHRTGFTATTLRKHLERTGFGNVRIWFSPFALSARGIKGSRD